MQVPYNYLPLRRSPRLPLSGPPTLRPSAALLIGLSFVSDFRWLVPRVLGLWPASVSLPLVGSQRGSVIIDSVAGVLRYVLGIELT